MDLEKEATDAARQGAEAFIKQSVGVCGVVDKIREGIQIAPPKTASACREAFLAAVPFLRAQRDALTKLIETLEARPS